jgi:hypothetical protein
MGTTRAAEWAERGTFEGPRIKGGSSQKHIFVGIAEKVPRANRIHYFMLL